MRKTPPTPITTRAPWSKPGKRCGTRRADKSTTFLQADRFEVQGNEGAGLALFEAQGWVGGDYQRFWFKTEGEYAEGGELEEAEIQGLYSRAISSFFDFQAGVRQDLAPGSRRTFGVVGVQGLAPYWFESRRGVVRQSRRRRVGAVRIRIRSTSNAAADLSAARGAQLLRARRRSALDRLGSEHGRARRTAALRIQAGVCALRRHFLDEGGRVGQPTTGVSDRDGGDPNSAIARSCRLSVVVLEKMNHEKQYREDSLSLGGAVAMGTGVMIGAGIFALTGQVAELAKGLFPVAFLAAALVAGFSAYSYVKLANAYPSAGGIAMFLEKAYGQGLLTAAYALMMYFSMVINESLVARTFGTYTLRLFDAKDEALARSGVGRWATPDGHFWSTSRGMSGSAASPWSAPSSRSAA